MIVDVLLVGVPALVLAALAGLAARFHLLRKRLRVLEGKLAAVDERFENLSRSVERLERASAGRGVASRSDQTGRTEAKSHAMTQTVFGHIAMPDQWPSPAMTPQRLDQIKAGPNHDPTADRPSEGPAPPPWPEVAADHASEQRLRSFLDDYNAQVTRPDKSTRELVDAHSLILLRVENYGERRDNPGLPARIVDVLERPVHYFGLEIGEDCYLTPSFDAYVRLPLLGTDDGRGGDAWLSGVFQVVDGNAFWVHRAALLRDGRVVEQGLLELPTEGQSD